MHVVSVRSQAVGLIFVQSVHTENVDVVVV